MAVTSILLGVLGLIAPVINIVALILGIVAVNQIDDVARGLKGRGLAIFGAILGGVGILTSCALLSLAMIVPLMEQAQKQARQTEANYQLKSIQQMMNVYAQSNNGWYPGLTSTGGVDAWGAVSNRNGVYGPLISQSFLYSGQLVSPYETDKTITGDTIPGVATSYGSYAVLEFTDKRTQFSRPTYLGRAEWRATFNSAAIIATDRQLTTAANTPQSLQSTVNGQWHGAVLFNDGHVQFEMTDKGFDGIYGNPTAVGATGTPQQPVATGTINNLFDLKNGNGRMISD